jgi:uncharacterized protein YycO
MFIRKNSTNVFLQISILFLLPLHLNSIPKITVKLCTSIIIFSVFLACSQKNNRADFENIAFRQGDIILRKGIGVKSRAVLHADSLGVYSHAGIVVLGNSGAMVVHITPGEREKEEKVDKIKIEPVGVFWQSDRAEHGALYRLNNSTAGSIAAQKAMCFLQKGITFDHDYELADTARMYCTELVWQAYLHAGTDITAGKRSEINAPMYSGTYIFPSDIYTNDIFTLIYKF